MLIRCDKSMMPELLRIILSSPYCWDLYRQWNQGTGAKHINLSNIRSLIVPVPPIAEQERIVASVDALMDALGNVGL